MALEVAVLLGLERGCEEGDAVVTGFVASRFQPRYAELLRGRKLSGCLDMVRVEYRNPTAHGLKLYDAGGYQRFAGLMVVQRRLALWSFQGPSPAEPGGEAGVFHHHLALSR
jgi:hypothetical protein